MSQAELAFRIGRSDRTVPNAARLSVNHRRAHSYSENHEATVERGWGWGVPLHDA